MRRMKSGKQAWQINVMGRRPLLPRSIAHYAATGQRKHHQRRLWHGPGRARGSERLLRVQSGLARVDPKPLAEEVWSEGIIANVLIPGPVKTELSKTILAKGPAAFALKVSRGRRPEQVVASALFLAAQPPAQRA